MGANGKLVLSLGGVAIVLALVWAAWPRDAGAPIEGAVAVAPTPPPSSVLSDAGTAGLQGETASAQASDARSAAAPGDPIGPAGAFVGSVVDPNGAPVPNATLKLYRKVGVWRASAPIGRGTSDANGRFTIAEYEPSPDTVLISAEAEGFLRTSVNPVVPGREIALSLRWATELFGRVVDAETGAPVAGARVFHRPDQVVHSAPDGSYRLPHVGVDLPVHVRAGKEGYAERALRVRLGEPRPKELEIRLERGVVLQVEVFDRETGAPLPGAELRRYDHEEPFAHTDADGRVSIRIADGTQHRLHVSVDGYCHFMWSWDIEEVDAVAPDVPARVPMVGRAWIEACVTDEDGAPVPGASGYASGEEHSRGRRNLTDAERLEFDLPGNARYETGSFLEGQTPSDEEGRLLVPVVPGPSPFTLQVHHDDYVGEEAGPLELRAPGDRVQVVVVLAKGGTVRGRVLYNGSPWRGYVFLESRGEVQGRAGIGEEGDYEVRNVRPGTARVYLRRLTSTRPVQEALVDVVAGEVCELDFDWEEELVAISGRVTSASGEPLADQSVRAAHHDPDGKYASFSAKTGPDGSYAVEVTAGGTFTVTAGRDPATRSRTDVPAGAEGVDFVLPAVGKLRLQLVDAATGKPIQVQRSDLWAVSWRETGEEVFRSVHLLGPRAGVDVEGQLDLELPVGQVDLRLYFVEDGYAREDLWALPVTADDDPAPHVVELTRGVELKIVLRAGSSADRLEPVRHLFFLLEEERAGAVEGPFPNQGPPSNHRINGINVRLSDHALMNRLLEIEADGTAINRGLAPGRYTLRVFPDDYTFDPPAFELGPEERSTIELVWSAR